MKTFNDDLQMRSDWYIPICQGEERIKVNGKKAHSTQKPEELLFRIILSTSNINDLILDPFSGSGTTAAVAKRLKRKFLGFERELFYVQVANERLNKIIPLAEPVLEYKIERRKPKVPFGSLIEKGFVEIGEVLYSKNGLHQAVVLADGSLQYGDLVASIHKVSAFILGKENYNGWSFWYVKRNGILQSIDDLRNLYSEKYFGTPFKIHSKTISKTA